MYSIRKFATHGKRLNKIVDLTRIEKMIIIDNMVNRIHINGTLTNILPSNHIKSIFFSFIYSSK